MSSPHHGNNDFSFEITNAITIKLEVGKIYPPKKLSKELPQVQIKTLKKNNNKKNTFVPYMHHVHLIKFVLKKDKNPRVHLE
jgi:hypothetical protein